MSCNCTQTCLIPSCIESLIIGTIETTDSVVVQFLDIVTGRTKTVEAQAEPSGQLIADVSEFADFFTPNFVYELRILTDTSSLCNTIDFTIGEGETAQTLSCVTLNFYDGGEGGTGIIKLPA